MPPFKNFKFLVLNDLSPKMKNPLSKKGYNVEHARTLLLHVLSPEKQVKFCFQNNYIIITQSKSHLNWGQKMNCETIFVNAPATIEAVAEAVGLYLKKAKIKFTLSG